MLDELPVGVVVLDRHGYVVKYNRFEEQLARRSRQQVIGRHFFKDVAVCTDRPELGGLFEEHIESNTLAAELDFTFELPFLPQPRDARLRLRSFDIEGNRFGILVVEDITFAKELERQRQRLIDIMVHDLRNPLQGILGYAGLLSMADDLPEEQVRQALESIGESAIAMERLLSGTLAEMHGEHRAWQPVNLHALVLSTLGNLLPVVQSREINLVYGGAPFLTPRFPAQAVVARGLVEQLASLVQNLIANAVKYASGEVRVDLREELGAVVLRVADDGSGIAPEDQLRIFEQGYQAADSLPGAGIGLYSVQRAVDAHGGEVTVRSAVGEGSTFTVTLPQEAPSTEA
ncbi:MAG: ATP-binding protein [Acidobacteriota bacterium]